jgi:hypothetical protein
VVELSHADLATPALRSVLSDYASSGRLLAGLDRYALHLPNLCRKLGAHVAGVGVGGG